MPTLHKTDTLTGFTQKAVAAIEDFLIDQLARKRILRVALSGGNSPAPVYEALAKSKKIEWSRVTLFLADERYVPLNSKESNYRMIQKTLVEPVGNIRRFYHYNTRDSIATIVEQYEKTLRQFDPPLFDLVILGMGSDGHTASLFPHDPLLHERNRWVAVTQKPGPDPQTRLTLTFPALLSSEKIIFLIRGAGKEAVVKAWMGGEKTVDELPAAGLLGHAAIDAYYTPA